MEKFQTIYGPLTESDIFPLSGITEEEKASISVVSH
jgi:hypothetical protein